MNTLKISTLNKHYGTKHALKDFSFDFSDGIYGLLGPNGAGKSTLMNILTQNLEPDKGSEILWNGENIRDLGSKYRSEIGFMPQQQELYPSFTLKRFMGYIAALKGIEKSEIDGEIARVFGSGNVYEYCATFFPTLGLCLMVDLWCKHNVRVLFNAIGVLEIYVYINLITVLLIPNGMYETSLNSLNWFLGYKNPQIRTILPIVTVSLIRSYWEKGGISFRSFALIICSMLTFIFVDSSTALVGFAIFILLLVLFHQKEKRLPKVFTLTNVLIAVVLIFIGILFFGIQENFAWLIEGICFNKSS